MIFLDYFQIMQRNYNLNIFSDINFSECVQLGNFCDINFNTDVRRQILQFSVKSQK